jgi:hypothetical protein
MIKKQNRLHHKNDAAYSFVVPRGLEPRQTVPKTVVLTITPWDNPEISTLPKGKQCKFKPKKGKSQKNIGFFINEYYYLAISRK